MGIVLTAVPLAALLGSSAEATMDTPSPRSMVQVDGLLPSAADHEAPLVEATDPLVTYLYESMRAWTKLPDEAGDVAHLAAARDAAIKAMGGPMAASTDAAERHAEELVDIHAKMRVRFMEIASDVVTVVRSEKPAFPSDENRSRTAVLVAGVALFEAAFQYYVDAGLCNQWKWRHPKAGEDGMTADDVKDRYNLLAAGSCDGGWAYTMWQIHPYSPDWNEGIVLLDDGREWSYAQYVRDGEEHEVIKGKDMIGNRQTGARVALHMLRRSLGARGENGLCGYTGEGGDCHKALLRENFAKSWSSKHPFVG
jgi:hypothetical protein